jgi:hypothetical protein
MKIGYREFVRGFGRYKGVKKVEVWGKKGLVGIWYGGDFGEVEEDLSDKVEEVSDSLSDKNVRQSGDLSDKKELWVKNVAYERFKEILGEGEEDEVGEVEKHECKKCGGVGVGTHRYWDEIEQEDVEDWFCGRCARGSGIKLKY